MVQQVELAKVGIVWAKDAFKNVDAIWHFLHPDDDDSEISRCDLSEPVLRALRKDVRRPIHDSLAKPWSPWWPLEWLPLWKHFLDERGERFKQLS